jgi:hypothetical protein
MNPSADQVLTLLPPDDVKIALQDRSKTAAASNKENGEYRSETEAMEEDGKSEGCLDEEKVEKGASSSYVVYDQEANNETYAESDSESHKGNVSKGKQNTIKKRRLHTRVQSSDSEKEKPKKKPKKREKAEKNKPYRRIQEQIATTSDSENLNDSEIEVPMVSRLFNFSFL